MRLVVSPHRLKRFLQLTLLSLIAALAPAAHAESAATRSNSSSFRLEREPVAGGAELITLFGRLRDPDSGVEGAEVPLLSVLRDTLGDDDSENDRLRYVWILTAARPTPVQRLASALSFICFRAGNQRHANRVPQPVLDLASPSKTVWPHLVANAVQASKLDPVGMMVRSSTRSYRANSLDYQKLQLYQALSSLDQVDAETPGYGLLSDSGIREVYSRLSLSDRTLGGLVRQQRLSRFYDKEMSRVEEMRGHNWELLRQRAESCGLYFDPLALPDGAPSQALLWIARGDLAQSRNRRFESQFLHIANPWNDERLLRWTGYTQFQYFDSEGRRVPAGTPGARAEEMIPLALYSLDYPKVPLLLADFRNSLQPKRRELVRRGATSLFAGILGISRFGNWPFFAAESAWTFVTKRHGAAVDRSARLRAYSETRQFLALDSRLDPKLKSELLRRLDHLALNPLENDFASEARMAEEQHASLLEYARSPGGLPTRLERDRRNELNSYTHGRASRILAGIGNALTRGPRIDPEHPDPELHAQLDSYRRLAGHTHFLEQVLASSPRPEVVWDANDIQHAVQILSSEENANPRTVQLIARVFSQTADYDTRLVCLRALQKLDADLARNELWRMSLDPNLEASWRALCLAYLNGNTDTGQLPAPAGQ